MSIFITGIDGFIGKFLALSLKKNGFKERGISRNKNSTTFWKKKGIKILKKDILKLEKEDLNGIKTIIHCAGKKGGPNVGWKELFRDNVLVTKRLVELSKGKKLIFLSSPGVCGSIINGEESCKYNPSNDYERSKMLAEIEVKKHNNYVIIRPEFVYGPMDTHVLPFFRSIKKRRFFLIEDGKTLIHPTYIGDVTDAVIKCINKNVKNDTFMIAGDKPISIKNFVRLISQTLGQEYNPIKVPLNIARGIARINDFFPKNFGMPFTMERVDFFSRSKSYLIKKAKNQLGFKPICLEEGIRKTIEFYKNEGSI